MSTFMKLKEAGSKVYVRLLLGGAIFDVPLQQSSTIRRPGTLNPTAASQPHITIHLTSNTLDDGANRQSRPRWRGA